MEFKSLNSSFDFGPGTEVRTCGCDGSCCNRVAKPLKSVHNTNVIINVKVQKINFSYKYIIFSKLRSLKCMSPSHS